MKHYVYQIDNLINGKYYRGKHSAESLDNDYMGSGTLIKAAIEKYGIENFKKTILKTFPTSQEAFDYEAQVVTMNEVNNPMCYNLIPGGHGGSVKQFTDEEWRERRREYHQQPEVKERKRERQREYNQRPEVKEREREHRQQPEVKERKREYDREWREQNPEYMREYMREYNQRPAAKERRKEYNQRPEVKERRKGYSRKQYLKRKAAKSR